MRILLTGYGSFGDFDVNPSAVIVNALSNDDLEGLDLHTKVISVDYADALQCSKWAREELGADFVIHVGVHPGKGGVFLETQAFRDGYFCKDVRGSVPLGNCCELINSGEQFEPAKVLSTSLDVEQLRMALLMEQEAEKCPIKIHISGDPGRYLCGYIYYCSLLTHDSRSLFVHVPPFDDQCSPELLTRLIKRLVIEVAKLVKPLPSSLSSPTCLNGV